MSRFLTPAKIGLLVLIDLYVEGAVPSDAIFPILSFITSHIMNYDPPPDPKSEVAGRTRAERTFNLVSSVKDFEKLLASYPFLMAMPGRRLWDQFLGKLWAINSLDGLNDFFTNIPALLALSKEDRRKMAELGEPVEEQKGVKLSKHSPFGTLVRRSCVEFSRLDFHDTTLLWRNFVRYRQVTAVYLSRKILDFPRLSFDNVLLVAEQEDWAETVMDIATVPYGEMVEDDEIGKLSVSADDVEIFLDFQLEKIQKFGTRVPLEVQHQFQDMLKYSPSVPSLTHYLKYLDAWRCGDYPGAFDSLYRYFDYTLQNKERIYYQYALMNLAMLHADFGCHQDALAAMLETVSTARENQDMACLNFALNWLFNFGRAHPDLIQDLESKRMLKTGVESLAYLRVKAREMGMWTLWSVILLSEVKLCLAKGDSVATALESMVRSSQVIVEKNTQNMFGVQLSMTAALWGRLGQGQLALDVCEVFLRCHTPPCAFDDVLRVMSRMAMLFCAKGKYDDALLRLEDVEENELRSRTPNHYWARYRGIIKLQRDLCHDNLDGAEQLLNQLLQAKEDDLEPDASFMIDCLHIDCLKRRGDFQAAFAKIEDMMGPSKDDSRDVALRVRLLLLKVSLLNEVGRPQRAFSAAIQAVHLARRARLMFCLWQATGALSLILVSMGEFVGAAQLLLAVLPRSLECESARLTGELYAILGDAYMGLAGQSDAKSPRRLELLTKAATAVQKAFDLFSSLEDIKRQCTLMAKKAVIMRVSGDEVLAEDYAAAYVTLQKTAALLKANP